MTGETLIARARELGRLLPESAGVYLLRGEDGEILYIGKSVNLRRRVLSHLAGRPPAPGETRRGRLRFEVRSIDHELVRSELRALLREDELIKAHQPRYNRRQNEWQEYRYLELTADRYPRLKVIEHEPDFGGRRVYGPYRDRHQVEAILPLVHRYLGLRSCADAVPERHCAEFDLGHCLGPCRGDRGGEGYAAAVARTVEFLEGDPAAIAERLRTAMLRAGERLEFEKAQALKEQRELVQRWGETTRFLRSFASRSLVIEERDAAGTVHIFDRGRPPGQDGAAAEDRRFVHDRALVVRGWLQRHRERCAFRFEDAAPAQGG